MVAGKLIYVHKLDLDEGKIPLDSKLLKEISVLYLLINEKHLDSLTRILTVLILNG